jgi:hypothetical protein
MRSQDKLERVAFSGTADLPFSPSQLYSHGWADDWEEDEFVTDTGVVGVQPLSAPWGGHSLAGPWAHLSDYEDWGEFADVW